MKKMILLVHNGFEEMEALTPVDLCRRAGMEVRICSMTGVKRLQGSHGIAVEADLLFEEAELSEYDAVVLPGGLPNSTSLRDDPRVIRAVTDAAEQGKWVAAICAAPIALERAGLLKGREATSYPGALADESACLYKTDPVVVADRIITSRGAGTAVLFALSLIRNLISGEAAEKIAAGILFQVK